LELALEANSAAIAKMAKNDDEHEEKKD